jgi:phage terminase large subunit-like protein
VTHVADATDYASSVKRGDIPAGKWVRLACDRHFADLKRKDLRFDIEAGERACKFIELLHHTKGKWAAKRETIRLEPWQRFLVCSIFGWYWKDGRRRFREAYSEIPRKNAKSTLAAGVGLYMMVADSEFGAEVYSGATTEKQAWEVFRPALLMAKRNPDLLEYYGLKPGAKSLYRVSDGSRFEPLIGTPGDGASPSCAIVDEYHEHQTDDLFSTMETGMGARENPLMFVITTAGSNLGGPCYDKRDYVQKVLEGTIEDDSVFGVIFGIDEGDDWTTEEALLKANPNYGVSISPEWLKDQQRRATQSARAQNAFKTKHLNMWVGAKTAWMNMETWRRCPPRKSLEELAGRQCFVGLDLASKVDIAAAVYLFPPTSDDPLWHVHGSYYLPESAVESAALKNSAKYRLLHAEGVLTLTPGNIIDFDQIREDIRERSKAHELAMLGYDPWQATHLATQLAKDGANAVEVRQTVMNLSQPMKEVEALVLQSLLAHGDCPALTWMVSNVTAKTDQKENIFPGKDKTDNKVDGAVALIMATALAMREQEDDISEFLANPVRIV